jgi:pseudaminic acid cytidylyltransferase
MSAVAIIPARGGSKRIPRKNIKHFNGKPMIAWTIERAVASNLFDEVIVSTDDAEIASIAKTFGASIDELRNPNLSNDNATLVEVMNSEAIKLIESNFDPLDSLCCLYPVSPLLNYEFVYKGLQVIKQRQVDFVISVKEFEQSPMRAFVIENDGFLNYKFPQYSNIRTQDLERLYTDAGQFTIATMKTWSNSKEGLNGLIYPIVLDKFDAIDIDEMNDWEFVEEIFEIRNKKK